MEIIVTDEIIARQPPEAQAIIRALLAQVAALHAEVAELKATNKKLQAEVDELKTTNKKLQAEVAELRRQIKGKTPKNSSLPPSSTHPHGKPKSDKKKSKKRRGGQPGHRKHERALIPIQIRSATFWRRERGIYKWRAHTDSPSFQRRLSQSDEANPWLHLTATRVSIEFQRSWPPQLSHKPFGERKLPSHGDYLQ